jgi:hypothetical protein
MDVVRSDGLGIRGEETRHQIDFANPRGRLTEHIFRLTHFFIYPFHTVFNATTRFTCNQSPYTLSLVANSGQWTGNVSYQRVPRRALASARSGHRHLQNQLLHPHLRPLLRKDCRILWLQGSHCLPFVSHSRRIYPIQSSNL